MLRQFDETEQFHHAGFDLGAWPAQQLRRDGDVLRDRSAKVRLPSNDWLTWSSSMSGAVAMGERITRSAAGRRGSGEPAIQTAIPQRTLSLPHPFSSGKPRAGVSISNSRQCRAARTAGGVISTANGAAARSWCVSPMRAVTPLRRIGSIE